MEMFGLQNPPQHKHFACSIRSRGREWWARQASHLPQVTHNGKAALSIWLCPRPWEEGLTGGYLVCAPKLRGFQSQALALSIEDKSRLR